VADEFKRMRQLVGSTADWAANNIVLGSGEIGIERVSATDIRIKVGDGSATWSALPYASASSTSINAATQAALDAKLAKSGGTMTGLLVLSGDAAVALGAVTKQQLDAVSAAATAAVNQRLPTSGGTLTGDLSLNGLPTQPAHAASKAYVDAQDGLNVKKAGDTMTGPLVLPADPAAALEAATKQYVDNGPYQTVVGGSAPYAGKVVKLNAAGVIDQSLVPIAAAYLGTVNVTLAYALTGTPVTGNYYAVSTTGTIDASWATRLNGAPTTASAGQFLIYNANGKWDLVGDTSSATAISGKLDKAGGTMTGPLVLAADPTAALEPATKQYADKMLPLAGGTLTGPLVLAADPTAALEPATKQYADSKFSSTGGTLTGKLSTLASATGGAGLTVTPGAAPTAPVDGDVWFTTAGMFAQVNGVTQQMAAVGHQHVIADVTGLQTALDAKAATAHTHTTAQISDTTAAGRTMMTAADAAAQRTALGLGALATATSVATAQIADNAVTGAKIALGSDALGDLMYYDGTNWVRLAAGAASTPGQVLKTNGAAAPSWLTLGTGAARNIAVGTTAPTTPAVNDIWVDTN